MNALDKFDAAFVTGYFVNHHEYMLNTATNVSHLATIDSSSLTVRTLENLFEVAESRVRTLVRTLQRLNSYSRDNCVGEWLIYSSIEATAQAIEDTTNAFAFINKQTLLNFF